MSEFETHGPAAGVFRSAGKRGAVWKRSPRRVSAFAETAADNVISATSAGADHQSKQAKLIQDADCLPSFVGANHQSKQAKLIQDGVLNQLLRSKPLLNKGLLLSALNSSRRYFLTFPDLQVTKSSCPEKKQYRSSMAMLVPVSSAAIKNPDRQWRNRLKMLVFEKWRHIMK